MLAATRATARWRAACAAGALVLALSGCNSLLYEGTGAAAGVAGTAIASQVTDNATVATGIGLGVQAGAKAALAYAQRETRGEEQSAIAMAAGPLDVGKVAQWSVNHRLPIERDAQGQVTVSREIGGESLDCKEIVFSVDADADGEDAGAASQRAFYVTTICRDGEHWRWASAEPATSRWGSLQ